MSVHRKRLSHIESRAQALDAASTILIESGPQAITLKAVGEKVGRTHANLLHHFGSAKGLHLALAEYQATRVCGTITRLVGQLRKQTSSGQNDNQELVHKIVSLTFDAFDKEGAGALTSWLQLTDNEEALDPIVHTIDDMVDKLTEGDERNIDYKNVTLNLVLMALGDALIGERLAQSLNVKRTMAREQAAAYILAMTS